MLDKRQVLEEQKFRLKQEESHLNLEAEIVKTVAKEQALAAIAEQSSLSVSPKPVKREDEFHEEEEFKPPPVMDRTVLNPEAPEWMQPEAANPECSIHSIYAKVPVARSTVLYGETSTGSADNASCSATQVHNGMVSTNDTSRSVTGAGWPRTGMAIVPVKVKHKASDDAIVTYAFIG